MTRIKETCYADPALVEKALAIGKEDGLWL